MKYFAYNTFTHNNKKINGGEVFDSVEVGFSQNDVDFLKTFQKIRPVLENKVIKKEPVKIETIEEPIVEKKEVLVEEHIEVEPELEPEKVDVNIKKLKRGELLKFASSLGIKNANKLSNKEVIEQIEEIQHS